MIDTAVVSENRNREVVLYHTVLLSVILHCWLGIRERASRRRLLHATLRLRSAIRRHHPPQRAVLSQICCFGERKVLFLACKKILLQEILRFYFEISAQQVKLGSVLLKWLCMCYRLMSCNVVLNGKLLTDDITKKTDQNIV